MLLRYTIVDFSRQKVLFGKRGKLVIKKKGGPRHSSYNELKCLHLYGMFNGKDFYNSDSFRLHGHQGVQRYDNSPLLNIFFQSTLIRRGSGYIMN